MTLSEPASKSKATTVSFVNIFVTVEKYTLSSDVFIFLIPNVTYVLLHVDILINKNALSVRKAYSFIHILSILQRVPMEMEWPLFHPCDRSIESNRRNS